MCIRDRDNKYKDFFDNTPEIRAYYRSDPLPANPSQPICSPNTDTTSKERTGEGREHEDASPSSPMEEEPTPRVNEPQQQDTRGSKLEAGDAVDAHT